MWDGNFAALLYSWLLQEFPRLPKEMFARSKTHKRCIPPSSHTRVSHENGISLTADNSGAQWMLKTSFIFLSSFFLISHKECEYVPLTPDPMQNL